MANQMADTEKNRFDALMSFRTAWWESYDKRRNHQWKLNFLTWTALALFTAAIIIKDAPLLDRCLSGGVTTFVCFFIILFHILHVYKSEMANMLDRRQVYKMDIRMLRLLDKEYLKVFKGQIGPNVGRLKCWLISSQIGITILLALAACAAVIFSK